MMSAMRAEGGASGTGGRTRTTATGPAATDDSGRRVEYWTAQSGRGAAW